MEIPNPKDPGRDIARANKRWNRQLLERLARDAGVNAPREVAGALTLLFEGAIVTAYVEGDEAAGRRARHTAERLLGFRRTTPGNRRR